MRKVRRVPSRVYTANMASVIHAVSTSRPPGRTPTRMAILRLTYHYREKYDTPPEYRYVSINLDPSLDPLCEICCKRLRCIIPKNGCCGPPNPKDLGVQMQAPGADAWEYWEPGQGGAHSGLGLPYLDRDGCLTWDQKIATARHGHSTMPDEQREHVRSEVEHSLAKYVVKIMGRDDDSLRYGKPDHPAAIEAAIRTIKRHGLPDRTVNDWEIMFIQRVWVEFELLANGAPEPEPVQTPPGQETFGGGSQ